MKWSKMLSALFHRQRFSSFLIALMMTLSMLLAINVGAKLEYTIANYRALQSSAADSIYYVQIYTSTDDLLGLITGGDSGTYRAITQLTDMSGVEGVYPIRGANPVSYNGESISIILYEPGMTDLLPKLGVSLSENSDGCILGSPIFSDLHDSDSITLEFYQPNRHTEEFPILGQLSPPYRQLNFSLYRTDRPTADDMFSESPFIIMPATEAVMARLEKCAQIVLKPSFMFSVDRNATQEDVNAAIQAMEQYGNVQSMEEILQVSEKLIAETLKTELPKPLFLLFASMVSYFSSLVLMVKRKERVLAVFYLCGASKRRYMAAVLSAGILLALIPTAICLLLIAVVPVLQWRGIIHLDGMLISANSGLLILAFFAATAALSAAVTVLSMRRHTPTSYLRGGSL